MDPRGGYVSKILHVKTKEPGPVGRAPPRSANDIHVQIHILLSNVNFRRSHVNCSVFLKENSLYNVKVCRKLIKMRFLRIFVSVD